MRKAITTGAVAAMVRTAVCGSPVQNVWAAADTKTETKTELNDSGILIAYYSATGNTKSAAEMIAKETGGELLELQPVEEYTDADLDYNDDSSRVCQEYADSHSILYLCILRTWRKWRTPGRNGRNRRLA